MPAAASSSARATNTGARRGHDRDAVAGTREVLERVRTATRASSAGSGARMMRAPLSGTAGVDAQWGGRRGRWASPRARERFELVATAGVAAER